MYKIIPSCLVERATKLPFNQLLFTASSASLFFYNNTTNNDTYNKVYSLAEKYNKNITTDTTIHCYQSKLLKHINGIYNLNK